MADAQATMMPPGDSCVRLLLPDEPSYEILATVTDVEVWENPLRGVPAAVPRFVGRVLLDSTPPIVALLRGKRHDAVEPLRGKFVKVIGTLMGTFIDVFWNRRLSAWVGAQVLSVRNGPGESKILEVVLRDPLTNAAHRG